MIKPKLLPDISRIIYTEKNLEVNIFNKTGALAQINLEIVEPEHIKKCSLFLCNINPRNIGFFIPHIKNLLNDYKTDFLIHPFMVKNRKVYELDSFRFADMK